MSNKPLGREETFLQTFLINHVEPFLAPNVLTGSGNPEGKVPVNDDALSSREQEKFSTTSLDENCIEFEFQMDPNYYGNLRQTYLALTLILVKGGVYDTYNTEENKKEEHNGKSAEATEAGETKQEKEDAPDPLVTHVDNILQSIFSNVEVYINIQPF